ncbi:MAG: N-acetyl-gamma-glutamyl-phosphate reductase [Oscillospiraceae bacterium]|jgi:N-acetyl-gamma-glutamyl-phosphate reductase|nr:N-acetyl-gamma-glutamyl-phosphate reductase [Oscillospiraceae bacterium]
MHTIFIDGAQGTTGLRLSDRLFARAELRITQLPEELRKAPAARRKAMQGAEITFLCLPDAAARESVELAQGTGTRIVDASTAHRTAPGWVYGFPELLPAQRERIAGAERVAVPGCHASGFAAIVAPLRRAGLLERDALLSCFSITGYSGGGKPMINEYSTSNEQLTNNGRTAEYDAPRQYALGQLHKHLREMCHVCDLEYAPVFAPIVADFPCGMAVSVPLHLRSLARSVAVDELLELFAAHYLDERAISVLTPEDAAPDGFLAANTLDGRDDMQIIIGGNKERALVTARFDNLGKGASGAAVQCMNLMLGLPEYAMLNVGY